MAPCSPMCIAMFLFLTQTMPDIEAAKILVLPTPVGSHMHVGGLVGRTLVEDGHDVWILAPATKQATLEKQGLHVLASNFSYMPEMENRLKASLKSQLFGTDDTLDGLILSSARIYKESNYRMSMEVLQNDSLMNAIAAEKFDLAVMGCFFILRSFYLIPYKYNIPYITFTILETPSLAGVIGMPSFQPSMLTAPAVTHHMTFNERLWNSFMYFKYKIVTEYMDWGHGFQDNFVPEKPSRNPSQLMSDSLLWLVAANDYCLDYPRMGAPNHRQIGTFSPEPAKELTGDLKAFVDVATKGLILVTFGTSDFGSMVMDHYLNAILEAVGQLDQRILLHHRAQNIAVQLPRNVRIEPWIPQNDVLGHRSTILMVQHGGVNGQAEATYHGVPQVCVGYQEEQRYNCRRLQHHHYGVALSLQELTATGLLCAIRDVINDPSYRSNVTRCSRIMHSLPQPRDELRFWVNHILEFGGAHLRPSSLDMPFYSLYMLDIMAFLVVILGFVLYVISVCVRCICKAVCFRGKQKRE